MLVSQQKLKAGLRSLHSAKSPLPLKISETLMRKALTRYQVDPTFLPVLYSFGDNPHLAESGSSNASSQTMDDGSRSKTALPSQNFP